jgi:hypothetical protein
MPYSVEIQSSGSIGRILVATRDFAEGDVVLEEAPLLVSKDTSSRASLAAYLAADEDTKADVMDMFHTAAPGSSVSTVLEDIFAKNALSYFGKVIAGEAHGAVAKSSALFLVGSKVEHSCSPNLAYNSLSGNLVYKAVTAIPSGTRLTFSYIDSSPEVCTIKRRRDLFETKKFICECARCVGPDLARELKCDKCANG